MKTEKQTKNTSYLNQYSKKCKICNKDIKGTTESQIDYNMKLHLEAHERDKIK